MMLNVPRGTKSRRAGGYTQTLEAEGRYNWNAPPRREGLDC
jgi:hypothetical protein